MALHKTPPSIFTDRQISHPGLILGLVEAQVHMALVEVAAAMVPARVQDDVSVG